MRLSSTIKLTVVMTCVAGAGCSQEASFSRDVMPILEKRCLPCHNAGGEGEIKSGFNVESYEGLMKGTKLGPVIVPGFSFSSTLQVLVEHRADSSINMPKGGSKLSQKEIETIGQWIDEGARNN